VSKPIVEIAEALRDLGWTVTAPQPGYYEARKGHLRAVVSIAGVSISTDTNPWISLTGWHRIKKEMAVPGPGDVFPDIGGARLTPEEAELRRVVLAHVERSESAPAPVRVKPSKPPKAPRGKKA